MTDKQLELWKQILLLVRHVRNCHELGPHPLRAEAVVVEETMERILEKDYKTITTSAFRRNTP